MYQTPQCHPERYLGRVYADAPAVGDQFVTEPIIAVETVYQQLAEEELHTLFEQAISDRLLAISMRLKRISGPLNAPQRVETATMLPGTQRRTRLSLPGKVWRRYLMLSSVALMLMLTGFDLMGMLVLFAR
jgi:hypothetical protein